MLTIFKTTLTNKKRLVNNTYFFTFKLIDPLEINFIPGQYLILKVQGKPRLYSVASSNFDKNTLEFIIELFPGGLASTYLENIKVGEEVSFQGPLGQFTLKENNKQKVFLVAGTGIAPVRSILISNPQLKLENYLIFWGLKTYKDVFLLEELNRFNLKICLSREQNLNMVPELDRKYFDLGHVDTCYFKNLNTKYSILNTEYYLCGGKNTVESLRQSLLSKNFPSENIILEKF